MSHSKVLGVKTPTYKFRENTIQPTTLGMCLLKNISINTSSETALPICRSDSSFRMGNFFCLLKYLFSTFPFSSKITFLSHFLLLGLPSKSLIFLFTISFSVFSLYVLRCSFYLIFYGTILFSHSCIKSWKSCVYFFKFILCFWWNSSRIQCKSLPERLGQILSLSSFLLGVINKMWSPRSCWQEFWDHRRSHFRLNQQLWR